MADWKFAHDGGRATPEYVKSFDGRAPHGELTLGAVGRNTESIAKVQDRVSDIESVLASIEGRLDRLDQTENQK